MKNTILFLFCFFLAIPCLAGGIEKVDLPLEVKEEIRGYIPDEIKGKKWNRWTSKNFVVCSIDNQQAEYLYHHLELVKTWIYSRWGLYDIKFDAECRLICVNDPELYRKMFRLDESSVEVRRNDDGTIDLSVVFLLLDKSPPLTVPIPLTEVCLAEFGQNYNEKFGWWANRGMSLLNGSIAQIKQSILDVKPFLDNDNPMYFSQGLTEMTEGGYYALPKEQRRLFDKSAMFLCLLMRKEFGQDKFHWVLSKTTNGANGESALRKVCGFDSYGAFDQVFLRYISDLCSDVSKDATPNSYLQVREKGSFSE